MTNNQNNALVDLGIGCLNTNGLGNKHKRNLVLNWLKRKSEGIIFIQESHSTQNTEREWQQTWGGKIIFNHGTSNSTGVAILFSKNTLNSTNILNYVHIVPGRATLVDVESGGIVFGLVNVYCPNNDDTSFLNNVFLEACANTKADNLVFAGDWNTILDNSLDKVGGATSHKNVNCQSTLNNIMGDWGYTDVFRLNNPDARIFTHFDKQHSTYTRLDFFLVDDKLVNLPICISNISHGFNSDHSYVSLTLQGNPLSHGRGYWKLNNSHLSSEEFTTEVKSIINETVAGSFDSYNGLWDTIKFRVKDYAIYFGKKTKKHKLAEKQFVVDKINNIKKSPNYENDPGCLEELQQLELRLDAIIRVEMEGVIVRSKTQYIEKGERCTKYFFGLEKSNAKKRMIYKLEDESTGETFLTQDKISAHSVSYFQNIYSTARHDHKATDSYLSNCSLNKIPDNVSENIDQNITVEEMESVIKNLKKNKSPGWDGLSAEFYQHFVDDIKNILFQAYLESIDVDSLSPSQRIGIINLISKPKPPPELIYLNNWRPITLLNVDYKIFTHIIKNRIVVTLPHLISNVQSGFQSGKSTSDNLILMCLVLDHFNKNDDESGLVLQVDFEKAFDTVDHYFLFKTMESMGFGPYLIKLVKICLHGCLSFININGHLSSQVILGRGLHQGSPLSPILFLLVAQVFTDKISNNHNIEGISVNGVELLLSLFADDSDLFLKASGACLDEVISEIKRFGMVSGCKNNIGKTKCIPLGNARLDHDLLSHIESTYGENFIISQFIALGVIFDNSSSIQEISDSNYSRKLDKAMSRAAFWNSRDLTIFGKVTIIKALLLAQFVYISTALLQPSAKIINSINKFIFNFLWGVKRDKIKRDIITQKRELGGLNMVYPKDFFSSMKLKLVHKIGNINFNHKWKDITLMQVKYTEHPGICFENGLVNSKFSFTYDLINCYINWREIAGHASNRCIDYCIWGNSRITDIGSKLWVTKLIDNNINYISEFVNTGGEIMSYEEFCVHTLDRCWNIISKREYVDLKMAIRRFSNPTNPLKDLKNIDPKLSLKFFTDTLPGNFKASNIRKYYHNTTDMMNIVPLKTWSRDLGVDNIDWNDVFKNLYGGFTKNLKLVQFQYKLLFRISTCRYMRFKMKIVVDTPNCTYCNSQLETLTHIFLECSKTIPLRSYLESSIREKILSDYKDPHKVFYLTCNHEYPAINYIWATFKLYLGRCFQLKKEPSLKGYNNYVTSILHGEDENNTKSVKLILGSAQ